MKKKLKVLLFTSVVICISPFWAWSLMEVEKRSLRDKFPQEKKDVVIILGGGSLYYAQDESHYMSSPSIDRLLVGLSLYRKKLVKKIILSGGDPQGAPQGMKGEGVSLKKFLLNQGVPTDDILLELESKNTFEHRKNISKIMKENNWQKSYLVTSAFHLPRTKMVMNKRPELNWQIEYVPSDFKISKNKLKKFGYQNFTYFKILLHEVLGIIYYRWRERI